MNSSEMLEKLKEINADIRAKELKPFLALYQALKVLLNDSIKLLVMSLDIGFTATCFVLLNSFAA